MGSLGPDAIARELEKVGVHVRAAWVESCAAHLLAAEPGFGSMPLRRRVDLCYLQFLHADMNSAGSGCLAPGDADGDPARDPGILGGRRVVQCDEVANVSASFNDRYKDQPACEKRVLKLALTDGPNRVVAYEYRPIDALAVAMPAGTKLALTRAPVDANGALRLGPENVAVLGGGVAHLEEARRRVVDRWKMPNRPMPGSCPGNRRAELRVAAWGRDASGGRSAAGTGTTDESRRTNLAPIPVAPVAPGKPSSPETEAPVEAPDSQVVDLTGEKEAPKEAPDERGPEEAPPGRVKRKRAVVIDDSDDDPTPARRKPTQGTQETPSRLARAMPRHGADTARNPASAAGVVLEATARATATPPSDAPPPKPPRWASRVVRSEPFAYAAAVRAMRAAAVRGQIPSTANVTLHGWFLRVAPARPAAGGGFEVAVSVHDGTGSLDAVVPAAMTLKLIDAPSAAAFDAMDEASRARLQLWAVSYLRGFLGKVTLRVRTFDDGAPAEVLKVFGPRDFHDAATTAKLGRRCDGIDKELKRLKQTNAEANRREETGRSRGQADEGEGGASGGAETAPSRARASTGAKVARGA